MNAAREAREFWRKNIFWVKMLWLLSLMVFAKSAFGQEAVITAPNTIRVGEIAVIDTSGSEGDRFDFNIIPAVPEGSLKRDANSKLLYFTSARAGEYLLVLTAYEGNNWKLGKTSLVVLGGGGTTDPVDPPPLDDPYGLTAATAKDCPPDSAEVKRYFLEMSIKIKAEQLQSKAIDDELHEVSDTWPAAWKGAGGHYNTAVLPVILRANLVKPDDWSDAYSDIARGIKE